VKLKLLVGDALREFELTRQGQCLSLTDLDGTTTEVQLVRQDEGVLELQINGCRVRAYGHEGGRQQHVWVNGRHWRYTLDKGGADAAGPDSGSLSTAIPAVVTEVRVQPGDTVKMGDKLVLLESMKMVLSVQAPQDGTIQAVHCQQGQSVEPGAPLVTFKEV